MITKMGMPYGGLKKAGFSGSHQGMRFFVKSYDDGETITAYVYPEPYNFASTAEEKKISETFPYSTEGVDSCIDWLNQIYEEKKEMWSSAFVNRTNAES